MEEMKVTVNFNNSNKNNAEHIMKDKDFDRVFEEERLVTQFTELLSGIMHDNGWNKAALAKELGYTKSYVTQLLRGNKNVSLRNLAGLLFKLGKRLKMEITDIEDYATVLRPTKECNLVYFDRSFRNNQYSDDSRVWPNDQQMHKNNAQNLLIALKEIA
jgi:transcriptional regulator with XRE-family HTH domain